MASLVTLLFTFMLLLTSCQGGATVVRLLRFLAERIRSD